MANKRRIARLNEQFRRELMDILQNQVRDPRIGPVTVTAVEVSPDLYHARVYVTALTAEERDEALAGLAAASAYIRGEVGRRLHIRRAPELDFVWDDTLEHARRIEQLLHEARRTEASDGTEEDGTD